MASLSLKVTSRSRKGLKGLPPTLEFGADATIADAKKAVAKATKTSDWNRIGIFDPVTKKTFKDRNVLLKDQGSIVKSGELLVKDLGPQASWRLVYMIEYLGPLIFHPLLRGLRSHIYPAIYPYINSHVPPPRLPSNELSVAQKMAFAMIMAHFVKRELETAFLHKFSANTMPAAYIFRNSFFYWAAAGLLAAFEIYAPFSPAALATDMRINYLGLALYVFGQLGNFNVHYYLATLRKPGETARKIPNGPGFNLVTCPNYMFEVIAWMGVILVARSPSLVLFISIGSYFMWTWGWGKEKAYRKEFGDKYKKKRFVMLPGLL